MAQVSVRNVEQMAVYAFEKVRLMGKDNLLTERFR